MMADWGFWVREVVSPLWEFISAIRVPVATSWYFKWPRREADTKRKW